MEFEGPETWNNQGITFAGNDKLEEAVGLFRKAIKAKPDFALAHYNLGHILARYGDQELAKECCQEAIRLAPEFPDAHFDLAIANLAIGEFAAGWEEYEWRRRLPQYPTRKFPFPEWNREFGKTVLLYCEQGFGDTIQFARYAELVKLQHGCRVYLEVQPALVRLIRTMRHIDLVIGQGEPLPPDIDYCLPLLSLPHVMSMNSEAALSGHQSAYLHLGSKKTSTRFRIGLCWSGAARASDAAAHAIDARRSVPLKAFDVLGYIPAEFVSLQFGLPSMQTRWSALPTASPLKDSDDFYATAEVISGLDMVITVDTAAAHVAGAMGKPVFLLNRFDSCWRWLRGREDSYLYPTLRIFTQPKAGDWESVLLSVRDRVLGDMV